MGRRWRRCSVLSRLRRAFLHSRWLKRQHTWAAGGEVSSCSGRAATPVGLTCESSGTWCAALPMRSRGRVGRTCKSRAHRPAARRTAFAARCGAQRPCCVASRSAPSPPSHRPPLHRPSQRPRTTAIVSDVAACLFVESFCIARRRPRRDLNSHVRSLVRADKRPVTREMNEG